MLSLVLNSISHGQRYVQLGPYPALWLMLAVFLMLVRFNDPKSKAMMVGLLTGLALFEEAGNGARFAIVPHMRPTSNGRFIPLFLSLHVAHSTLGLTTGVTAAARKLSGIAFFSSLEIATAQLKRHLDYGHECGKSLGVLN